MPSPYIQNIKNWKIREMVVRYLMAKAKFEKHNKPTTEREFIAFATLKDLCNEMYEIKEDHHLIFKKLVDPKNRKFEDANKFTPNEGEINFMNNVGLLFHKVMIARELKYMLNYYTEDSKGYQESRRSLERNLCRIEQLFDQGIDVLLTMLKSHTNNIHLITYVMENQSFCVKQLNCELEKLLLILTEEKSIEDAYVLSAKYYYDSGWADKARDMCQKSLVINPENQVAQSLMEKM